MPPTTWLPAQRAPRQWLLANGKKVAQPEVEETTSKRKVRIAGTSLSVFSGGEADLVYSHVEAEAKRLKSKILFPIVEQGWSKERHPQMHFTNGRWSGTTQVWWLFQHPSIPEIQVHVELSIRGAGGNVANDSSQLIQATIQFPVLHPEHSRYGSWRTISGGPHDMVNAVYYAVSEHDREVKALHEREPLTWSFDDAVSTVRYGSARAGAKAFLDRIRVMDDALTMRIPDMTNPQKPTYMALEVVDSNLTGELVESLRDFLDSGPALERAAAAYQELQAALKNLGLVLESRSGDHLFAALQGGANALSVPVGNASGIDGPDPDHKLLLRPATGSFVVVCAHRGRGADKNAIAERWDEVRTIASITGQEGELLGFAKAFASTIDEERARRILDEY